VRNLKYPQKANENTANPTKRPMTTLGGDTEVLDTYPVLGRSRMWTNARRVTP